VSRPGKCDSTPSGLHLVLHNGVPILGCPPSASLPPTLLRDAGARRFRKPCRLVTHEGFFVQNLALTNSLYRVSLDWVFPPAGREDTVAKQAGAESDEGGTVQRWECKKAE
jgi:hypothetical protein